MRAMQIIEWGKTAGSAGVPGSRTQGRGGCCCASKPRASATATCTSGTGTSIWAVGSRSRSNRAACACPSPWATRSRARVAALGPQASGVKVGDKVVAYPWIGCGGMRGVSEGRGTALPPTAHAWYEARRRAYGTHFIVPHGRYLLPHEGSAAGSRCGLHLLRHHRLFGAQEDAKAIWAPTTTW